MYCLCCNEKLTYCECSRGKCSGCKNCRSHCVCERRNNKIAAELDKVESININESYLRRIQQLENELLQVKNINRSLMEENEAFQLLLHEKTMEGKFMLNPIMQRNDSYLKKQHEQVVNDVSKEESSSPQDDDNPDIFKNSDLASELNRASVLSTTLLGERVYKESDILQKEIKSLKDANKSMTLYIEKILNRILEAQGFEELLSSEWKPSASSPTTPTIGSFSFNNNLRQEENKTKKIERRMTWHFRSISQPQNIKEPDHYSSRKLNEDTATRHTRRFSLFNWG